MIAKRLRILCLHTKEDSGSVLIFGIGLSFLLLLLTTLVITYASAWSQKITLQRISDAAVLSSAQAVDTRSIYRDQLNKGVTLNSSLAKQKVNNYLNQQVVQSEMPETRLTSISINRSKVTITLIAPLDLPFNYLLPEHPRFISSISSAKLLIN